MSEALQRAESLCTIFGGANGSGKSTIVDLLKPPGEFINADRIARRMSPDAPEKASIAAGREVLASLTSLVARGETFIYETTLSSQQSLTLMQRCRDRGYRIDLIFVLLERPELNVKRVEERVQRGGHDIPVGTIWRRYESAFERLPHAMAIADTSLVFDNSSLTPKLILTMERELVLQSDLDVDLPSHRRIKSIVALVKNASKEIETDAGPSRS